MPGAEFPGAVWAKPALGSATAPMSATAAINVFIISSMSCHCFQCVYDRPLVGWSTRGWRAGVLRLGDLFWSGRPNDLTTGTAAPGGDVEGRDVDQGLPFQVVTPCMSQPLRS